MWNRNPNGPFSFILIDRVTNATVAVGMIGPALKRAQNICRQHLNFTRKAHAELKGQQPWVLWFTADRVENSRRVGEVAKLMADARLIVLSTFISPFRAERQMVRLLFPRENSSKSMSIHRSPKPRGPTRKGYTTRRAPASSEISLASMSLRAAAAA
jgi:hypothetical protein